MRDVAEVGKGTTAAWGVRALDEHFVGRAGELAILERELCRAAEGHSQLVVVRGPVGIGKTALIRRFLVNRPVRVGWACGDQDEISLAGGLLEQLARSAQDPRAEEPSDIWPVLELLSTGETDPLRTGSALLALLQAWPGSGPLVVVFDDAQWGDELSLRALGFALRRLRCEPVLGIVAVRTDDFTGLPPGLARVVDNRGTRLDIRGFGAEDVAALAEQCGVGRLTPPAAQRLQAHTGGVPLHVMELLHALSREELCRPDAVLPAPRSLEALVLSRLAGCARETRQLVVATAVLGGHCRLADAAALAGLPDPLPALQEAVRQRLLDEADTIEGRCCEFPHALIRAAVYRDIGVSRRAALHRQAATLSSGPAALWHRVAACPGADAELAADLEARAVAEIEAGRPAEAVGHLLAAVRVCERGTERNRQLLMAVGLLLDMGETSRARTFAEEIMAMPPSGPRSVTLGRLAVLARDHAAAERWLADAAAGPVPQDPQLADGAAMAACELALLLLRQRRTEDSALWARRAARNAASSVPRACAHVVLGTSLALAGQADDAMQLLRAQLAGAGRDTGDDDPARLLIRAGIGTILLWCDDLPGAVRHLGAASSADGRRGFSMSHVLEASVLKIMADYRAGAWDEAAAGATRLVALIDDLDQDWLLASAHATAVYTCAGRGQWDLAMEHADAAASRVRDGLSDRLLEMINARAALAFARDDPDAVLAAVSPVAGHLGKLAGLEPALLGFWPLYAHALVRTGQLELAEEVIRPFAALARERGRRSAMAAADRVRGFLEAARHRPEAARAAYLSAIAGLSGLGMPYEEALTRLDYGRFLRHAGQRRAALRELCAARALFTGLGAVPFVAKCDAELGQEAPGADGYADGSQLPLTSRQLAVARAVAKGKSNHEVARELYISVKTVEYHVNQILTRLSIDARTEIAAALDSPVVPQTT
jgi:DNA-binding CsgD family transcriptional regulator